MHISVNNKSYEFESQITLDTLLNKLDISINGIAVAVNENIISRTDWNSKTFKDGDQVLIIKATQGG